MSECKKMRKAHITMLFLLAGLLLAAACGQSQKNAAATLYQCPMKCEGEKTYPRQINCPVCNMRLQPVTGGPEKKANTAEIPELSIFHLSSEWHTQAGDTVTFRDFQGDILVVVMIYTSCKSACPRLVADMRNIHQKVGRADGIKYIFVSIDPETDTPDRLKEFARKNLLESDEWVFLHGSTDDVREFSNVVAVKYKKISPIDFSHSNIISVFDRNGVLYYQQEGLGVDNKEIVAKIKALRERGR